MIWQESPYTVLAGAAAALSVAAALYIGRLRVPGARTMVVLLLACSEWAVAYVLELGSDDLAKTVFWHQVMLGGVVAVPTVWLIFTLRYTGNDRWLTPRNLALLALMPAATELMIFTNGSLGLMWSWAALDTSGSFSALVLTYAPGFWAHTAYSYLVLIVAAFVLVQTLFRSRHLYRWQTPGLLFAACVPWLGNVMFLTGFNPFPGVDLTGLGFNLTSLTFAWSLSRLRLGDIVSVSRGAIIENMGDGLLVLDAEDRVLDLNPVARRLAGREVSRLVGRPVDRVWPQWPVCDDSPGEEQAGREMVLEGDGGQRTFDVRISPLRDWRGRLVSKVVVLRDITERKRAEEALQESEARFRRLTENAQDFIFRFDYGTGRFAYVSPAIHALTGYTPEALYADPDLLPAIVHPDDRGAMAALKRGEIGPQTSILRWRHRDGQVLWTEQRLVPVFDEAGKLVAAEGIARDITERKQLEEQLLRAHRLETAGRIAGQVAHDFNNLLAPLAAYPELIERQLPENHPASQYCDAMMEAAEQMADINEDMMALGRRGHFDEQPVELNRIASQAVEQMGSRPDGLAVNLELAPGLLPVAGSPAQLLRVVSNLVANAREAMQDAGTLTVRTENLYVDRPFGHYNRVELGEYVRLSVGDTGSGIAPEIRDRIFDAFFTTKSRANRRGCGLGLSVVQAIVEDHRGHLDLESEVGKGTTFSVYLPVSREELKEKGIQGLQGGSEMVLVVDDDRLQREVARELLQTLGYQVEAVASGEEALDYLQNYHVELLILDMIMPGGMDGAETYQRALELRPGQPAIVVSGFAESDRVREAQRLGAGGYLRKPVTLEELARAVREELDRRMDR